MQNATRLTVYVLLGGLLACGCKSSDAPPDKYDGSSDVFDKASADPPLTAKTRVAAGMLAESQGDFARAEKQYREAMKLDPSDRDALFHLSDVLTKQTRYPEAIASWQSYLQATSNAPAAYCDLAFCYEIANMVPQSEATYRAGMAQNPTDNTCRLQYGMMLARQNRFDDAAAQLTPMLKPGDIDYRFGIICERQNKPDQAKAWYIKALQQDPTMSEPKARLAVLK